MKGWDVISEVPKAFLELTMREVRKVFPRPTLIELPGESPPLFISILLHGNEDAGLLAMQDFFRTYDPQRSRRGIKLFVGDVDACEAGVRYLDATGDFNRAWPGTDRERTPIHDMLESVTEHVLQTELFASIDIHNNTGRNPHYGCICTCAPPHVNLASLFSSKVVYFTRPRGVQTQAFMAHCPSLTCECGQIGDRQGAVRAANLIRHLMECDDLAPHGKLASDVQVYHTVARIKIKEGCTVSFEEGADIVLREDIDMLNFTELSAGERLAKLASRLEDCLYVSDEHGRDVTETYLSSASDELILERDAMPSMLTRNVEVIRQDCFGYLMERFPGAVDH